MVSHTVYEIANMVVLGIRRSQQYWAQGAKCFACIPADTSGLRAGGGGGRPRSQPKERPALRESGTPPSQPSFGYKRNAVKLSVLIYWRILDYHL